MAHSAGTSSTLKGIGPGHPVSSNHSNPDQPTNRHVHPKQLVDMIEIQELVGTAPEKKNWRGILIAILVIIIVLILIAVAVILVSPKEDEEFIGDDFQMEDMFKNDYKPRNVHAQWMGKRNTYIYRSREGEVMEYNAELNETNLIMNNSTFRDLDTDVYFVSEDLQFVLVAYQIEPVYRHSFKAKYKIYNRAAKSHKEKFIDFPQYVQGKNNVWHDRKLQYAGWSETGHGLTFVYENNLYHQTDPFTTPSQITNSGDRYIYNGISDWLYEEEVLHDKKAHWWSPEGAFIAYAEFDDTLVPKYRFPYYGDGSDLYGEIDEIPYPKAGDKSENINPRVRVYLLDTSNPRATQRLLTPPPEFDNIEYYLTSIVWADENTILAVWLNRPQNVSIVRICHAMSADCHNNLKETAKDGKGWVSFPQPRFIEEGQTYLTVLPGRDGQHGYWKHITMVTAQHGSDLGRKTFITQGTFDILKMVGYDEEKRLVYYLGNNGDTKKRHLFSVGISNNAAILMEPECLTCDLPDTCQYVSASFSRSGQYYILECLGPAIPTYTLRSTKDNREIVLEDNADIQAKLDKKAMPVIEYLEIEDPTGTYKITAKVMLPPVLQNEQIFKYPVLVYTYAAPETQKVTEEYHIGWDTVLVSSQHVIYVMIDGRGTSGRGDKWLHQVYKQLGVKEVEDQIIGAKYMKRFPYVDPDRIAIWGWSYGGFVTAHALADEASVFSCGIAVAPVTDWRYYDTAYTERYMGLANLEENFRGYFNSNVSRKAKNFHGKNLMLVHGTADDNVHFQHSAQLAKALTEQEVEFRIQMYSDKNHALSGPKTSRHLYTTMNRYLTNTCWKGGKPLDPSKQPEDKDLEES